MLAEDNVFFMNNNCFILLDFLFLAAKAELHLVKNGDEALL